MKSKLFLLMAVFGVFSLIFQAGCKTAEDANQYSLTVTVGEGITGSPAAGTHANYSEGELVDYSYAVQSGYKNLTVTLDGVEVGSSGTVTMNMNHTLAVTADKIFDVRGEWNGILTYDKNYNLQAIFSGGLYAGTVSSFLETVGNGNGNYSISDGSIEFKIVYMAGTIWYSGSINNEDNMSGTFITSGDEEGTWELDRN